MKMFIPLFAASIFASSSAALGVTGVGTDNPAPAVQSVPASNYVRLNLPRGVSFELPKNWVAFSGSSRVTLDAAVEAMFDSSGRPVSELPFAANLYDNSGKAIAIFNVRYYPEMDVEQSDIRKFTAADVRTFDQELQATMKPSMIAAGLPILAWLGTRRVEVGGKTVLVSEYKRAGLTGPFPFRVRLFRVLDASKSFTITYSYNEALAVLLRPISDRVFSSVRASP